MHQYARYYERFRGMIHSRPLAGLVAADVLARFQSEVQAEGGARPELEIERDVRTKIDALYYETFTATQNEVTKRWTYESEIKRPYFHVTELEHPQLANWRKYLDFEESEGDYERIVCLYERCLTSCAFYDDLWFRYVRWMGAQDGKDEEVRNIYIRASTMFVPISRPGIRLQWAYFEESSDRVDVAADIHSSILLTLPNCIEVIVSLANLRRRQGGIDDAVLVLKEYIDAPAVDVYTKAALVGEWAQLVWLGKRSAEEARAVFSKNSQSYADSILFWEKWLQFELGQTQDAAALDKQAERLKQVFDEMRRKSRLSAAAKRELALVYMNYLVQQGGKDAMKVFLQVDREIFG